MTVAPPRLLGRASERRIAPATWALGVLLAAAAVLLLYTGRHLTFFFDEWEFILHRRGDGIGTYLDPHDGHLSLFPVFVYKLLFATVGLRHYTPYRAIDVALDLASGTLLFVLVRRRIGPWLALVPTALLLFMGTASQDLLWPFQIGFLASVAGGLGALVLLERVDRRADACAAALIVWSLSASGVGLAFLIACAVLLIAQGGSWRRIWVVALPAGLFAIWYIGWGTSTPITSDAILAAPEYIANAVAGAVAGIAGLSTSWGPPLAVGAIVAIAASWRSHRVGPPTPLLLASLAGALTFWGLAAVERTTGPDPAAGRYLYIGAVFIWLVAAEAGVGAGLSTGWLALAGLLVIGALTANLGALRDNERGLRTVDDSVRASLAVVNLAAPVVAPSFVPEPLYSPEIRAGLYLAAAREIGSPALSLGELEHAPEAIRSASDGVLERAEALAFFVTPPPISGSRPLQVDDASGGRIIARGICRRLEPNSREAVIDVAVPPAAELLIHPRGSVNTFVRRFSSSFPGSAFATVPAGASAAIRFPLDRAPGLSWHVQVNATAPLELCVR